MSKSKYVAALCGFLLSPTLLVADTTIEAKDNVEAKIEVKKSEAKLYASEAEAYENRAKMIKARQDFLKAELKAAAGETIAAKVQASEPGSDKIKDGMAVVFKAEPIDSVCVTKIAGPATELSGDIWFRGELFAGMREGQIISEGVRLQKLHTSGTGNWGVEVHYLGKTKFVPMCDLATAKSRGVPEKKRVY